MARRPLNTDGSPPAVPSPERAARAGSPSHARSQTFDRSLRGSLGSWLDNESLLKLSTGEHVPLSSRTTEEALRLAESGAQLLKLTSKGECHKRYFKLTSSALTWENPTMMKLHVHMRKEIKIDSISSVSKLNRINHHDMRIPNDFPMHTALAVVYGPDHDDKATQRSPNRDGAKEMKFLVVAAECEVDCELWMHVIEHRLKATRSPQQRPMIQSSPSLSPQNPLGGNPHASSPNKFNLGHRSASMVPIKSTSKELLAALDADATMANQPGNIKQAELQTEASAGHTASKMSSTASQGSVESSPNFNPVLANADGMVNVELPRRQQEVDLSGDFSTKRLTAAFLLEEDHRQAEAEREAFQQACKERKQALLRKLAVIDSDKVVARAEIDALQSQLQSLLLSLCSAQASKVQVALATDLATVNLLDGRLQRSLVRRRSHWGPFVKSMQRNVQELLSRSERLHDQTDELRANALHNKETVDSSETKLMGIPAGGNASLSMRLLYWTAVLTALLVTIVLMEVLLLPKVVHVEKVWPLVRSYITLFMSRVLPFLRIP